MWEDDRVCRNIKCFPFTRPRHVAVVLIGPHCCSAVSRVKNVGVSEEVCAVIVNQRKLNYTHRVTLARTHPGNQVKSEESETQRVHPSDKLLLFLSDLRDYKKLKGYKIRIPLFPSKDSVIESLCHPIYGLYAFNMNRHFNSIQLIYDLNSTTLQPMALYNNI